MSKKLMAFFAAGLILGVAPMALWSTLGPVQQPKPEPTPCVLVPAPRMPDTVKLEPIACSNEEDFIGVNADVMEERGYVSSLPAYKTFPKGKKPTLAMLNFSRVNIVWDTKGTTPGCYKLSSSSSGAIAYVRVKVTRNSE